MALIRMSIKDSCLPEVLIDRLITHTSQYIIHFPSSLTNGVHQQNADQGFHDAQSDVVPDS